MKYRFNVTRVTTIAALFATVAVSTVTLAQSLVREERTGFRKAEPSGTIEWRLEF